MTKKIQAAKRSNKPLAWFLNENEKEERETPSPALSEDRKSSVDSLASSVNSIKINEQKEEQTGGKKKGKKGARQRAKKVSVNFTIAGSESKDAKPATVSVEEKTPMGASQLIAAVVAKDRKEDYWYYDPVSDGFYYENNGSRGWRKRNPKVHGPPPSQKKTPEVEKIDQSKIQMINGQKVFNQVGAPSSVRYYDPASDGYFFEMASVDGWRRRQPAAQSQNPSMDKKIPQPPPMSNQHFPPLGTASQTATPTPSPAGSYIPQPQLLTNTQLEDMIVRHPSLVASLTKTKFGLFDAEPIPPSNSSTTSSSVSEELTTPPPQTHQNSMFIQHFKRGQQLQQSNSAGLLNGQQSGTFSVGSSDEPYEFYWSDTEKPSSISSFDDVDFQSKAVGSTRRPETLNFHPVEKPQRAWWETNTVEQPKFDVDRFIADLPSFDEDKILQNLCSQPTPIGERRRDTEDSTIYTPMKENSAWYNQFLVRTPVKSDKPAPIDIEKIWRTPCA